MDIDRLERLINEYGLPSTEDDIIRIVRESRGVDVTNVIRPPILATNGWRTYTAVPFERTLSTNNRIDMAQAYERYRSANRMSALAHAMSGDNFFSAFRHSSPKGCVQDYQCSGVFNSHFNALALQNNRTEQYTYPVPFVLDQNTRLDLEPEQIGPIDHVRIQCLLSDGVRPSPWGRYMTYFPGIQSRWAIMDTTEIERTLVAAGWEIITKEGPDGERMAMGAMLPETADPDGRHLIVFRLTRRASNTDINFPAIAYCATKLIDRWNRNAEAVEEAPQVAAPTESDIALVGELQAIRSFSMSFSARARDLEILLNTRREQMTTYGDMLANTVREIDEYAEEIELLSTNLDQRVLERARAMYSVVDEISPMRPVQRAWVESSGNNVLLKVVTHKFGLMNGNNIVEIPRIRFEINMMADRYSDGIKVYCHDPYVGVNRDYRYLTPHCNASRNATTRLHTTCWGNAGRQPLPEAWGRRDWATVMRLLFSWVTQYNGNSPLVAFNNLLIVHPRADRGGWLTELATPVEVDEVPQVEEVVEEAIPF